MSPLLRAVRCLALAGCLGLVVVWLLGCDSAATTTSPAASAVATTPAASTPAAPASTPAPTVTGPAVLALTVAPTSLSPQSATLAPTPAPCVVAAAAGQVPLLPLPAAVRDPVALALLQGRVYVAGRRSANIGVVENDRLQSVLPAGDSTAAIAADETLGALFVLDDKLGQLSMLRGGAVQATIAITDATQPGSAAGSYLLADPASHRLFAAMDTGPAQVVVIDTQAFKVSRRVPLPGVTHVGKMTLDAQDSKLWFAQYDSISALDLNSWTVSESVRLPGSTYGVLLFEPQARRLYADYYSSGSYLAVIEGGKLSASVPVGADPADAVVSGPRLYVANSYSNTLSVIDMASSRVVTTIAVGVAPRALLADPSGGRVYAAVTGGYAAEVNRLEVVDAGRDVVSGSIPLSANVSQLVADQTRGRLYILLPSSREVLVSDGQQVLARVPLGFAPQQMALDEPGGRLYVTDYTSQQLSVVDVVAAKVVDQRAIALSSPLDAVAVDTLRKRVLLGNRTFAPDSLSPTGHYTLTGFTLPYGDGMIPTTLLANPSIPRIYAVAGNGVPGSNGGVILYAVDGDSLQQIALSQERNVSAVVLDNAAQRLYQATTHPLAGYTRLGVLDPLSFKTIATLDLPAHVTAMALNEQTHHLFLTYHAYGTAPSPLNDVMQVLDTRSLGSVLSTTVVSEPVAIAVLGDRAYVAGSTGNSLAVYRDCQAGAPPAPTPTQTPTPYPTLPPAPPTPTPTRAPQPTAAVSATTSAQRAATPFPMSDCAVAPATWLGQWFNAVQSPRVPVWSELGCPVAPPRVVQIAIQAFANGYMMWRGDTHKITVAQYNLRWTEYDDTWDAAQPEGGTEQPPSAGLIAPKRGFGKIWREKLGGVTADIGWATEEERGIASELQDFAPATAYKDHSTGFGVFYRNGTWK